MVNLQNNNNIYLFLWLCDNKINKQLLKLKLQTIHLHLRFDGISLGLYLLTPHISIFFQVLVKVDLELVDCLGTDYVSWEAIPVVYHSLREEVFTKIEIFSQPFLEDLLAVASCGSFDYWKHAGIYILETTENLEGLDEVTSHSSHYQWVKIKLLSSLFVFLLSQAWYQFCCSPLHFLKTFDVLL